MKKVIELVELAKKATLGRNYDRLDSCGGGIKYQCLGNDGSLVLQCDHKNNEYGFIGPKSMEDEAFFLACKPETIITIAEEFMMLQQQLTATTNSLTNAQKALKSAGIEADTVQAGVMELKAQRDALAEIAQRVIDTGELARPEHESLEAEVCAIIKPTEHQAKDAREGFEYMMMLISRGLADIERGVSGYHDPQVQVFWENYRHSKGLVEDFSAQLRAGNAGKDGVQ